mmetsp:Transcript_51940/g.137381  ORF Transcript_51940/g.137381 Transcript_51940/m.137381 type:complete len:374 (+) Transcript_51940:2383-3504(+)
MVDRDLARGVFALGHLPENRLEQGRLPAASGAHNRHVLSILHRNTNITQHKSCFLRLAHRASVVASPRAALVVVLVRFRRWLGFPAQCGILDEQLAGRTHGGRGEAGLERPQRLGGWQRYLVECEQLSDPGRSHQSICYVHEQLGDVKQGFLQHGQERYRRESLRRSQRVIRVKRRVGPKDRDGSKRYHSVTEHTHDDVRHDQRDHHSEFSRARPGHSADHSVFPGVALHSLDGRDGLGDQPHSLISPLLQLRIQFHGQAHEQRIDHEDQRHHRRGWEHGAAHQAGEKVPHDEQLHGGDDEKHVDVPQSLPRFVHVSGDHVVHLPHGIPHPGVLPQEHDLAEDGRHQARFQAKAQACPEEFQVCFTESANNLN